MRRKIASEVYCSKTGQIPAVETRRRIVSVADHTSVHVLAWKRLDIEGGLSTSSKIIETPNLTLKSLHLSSDDIELIRKSVASATASKKHNIKDLLDAEDSQWDRISFGCCALDTLTGGVKTRGVTEIFGESGVGKTQLLLQLSLMVQFPKEAGGLSRGAVFICTEDVFPSKRLHQLIKKNHERFGFEIDYSENIFVEHIIEAEDLLTCVRTRLPKLMARNKIGLIIIDSIAAAFRLQTNFIARATSMRNLANILLRLVDKYNCAVVCANQVTSIASNDSINQPSPSLGLAWANLVRTRLRITKTQKELTRKTEHSTYTAAIRSIDVIFSPDVGTNSVEFAILEEGVVDLPH